ncbi:MAG: rhodanese-like domain-containing protein [Deinococcota bacterium]
MTLWHDAFYKFVALPQADTTVQTLQTRCEQISTSVDELLGSILIAPEGINGMIASSKAGLAAFHDMLAVPEFEGCFADIDVKRSPCNAKPFGRLKIKRKREIVPLGIDGVDATARTGINVSPEDWRELLEQDDVVVIDNRNDFEVRLGQFKGAINPHVNNFRDFPAYVEENLEQWEGKRVAMYCTGGIRCEKTSSWLLDKGLEVYQLEGGILGYFAKIPDPERDWDGECFVFDNRVALDTNLQETATKLEDIYDAAEEDERWRLERAKQLSQTELGQIEPSQAEPTE